MQRVEKGFKKRSIWCANTLLLIVRNVWLLVWIRSDYHKRKLRHRLMISGPSIIPIKLNERLNRRAWMVDKSLIERINLYCNPRWAMIEYKWIKIRKTVKAIYSRNRYSFSKIKMCRCKSLISPAIKSRWQVVARLVNSLPFFALTLASQVKQWINSCHVRLLNNNRITN